MGVPQNWGGDLGVSGPQKVEIWGVEIGGEA